MSLIRLHRQPQITEEQIRIAQDAIDRWVAIRNLVASNGWHYLAEDIKKEISRLDTIKGVTVENLKGKAEKLEGLEYPFTRFRDYEKAASEGEKLLALVAGATKE